MTRLARAEQSAAAAALLAELRAASGLAAGPHSRSHSRAVSAAAIAAGEPIGVDIEYCDARRNIDGLARSLLGADASPLGVEDFYRLWTFHEAYFKAFGAFADASLRRALVEARAKLNTPFQIGGDVGVMHAAPVEGFLLTLVWADEGRPVLLDI